MDIKSLFGTEKLSYEEFQSKLGGVELVDKSTTVDKEKFDAQVELAKDFKSKHAELSKAVEGDEGYKIKLEQIEKERDEFKTNLETLTKEKTTLERDGILSKAGVKDKFKKFALSEVNSLVDDKTDFNKALESWKKDNGDFFATEENKGSSFVFNQPTGVNKNVTDTADKGSIMNNLLKGAIK